MEKLCFMLCVICRFDTEFGVRGDWELEDERDFESVESVPSIVIGGGRVRLLVLEKLEPREEIAVLICDIL